MQLEYILQAHGLVGKGTGEGGEGTPLPELINFTAITNGSVISLNWENSNIIEYVKTEIFVSTQDITNANYNYCAANAIKIVDSNVLTSFDYSEVSHNTIYYFKGFMTFNVMGTTKINNGVITSCLFTDIIPPGSITGFTSSVESGLINLEWINPTDADFNKVKILYKLDSYPTDTTDGTVAYEGSGTTQTINGLTDGLLYYIRAFTYDNSNNINDTTENQQIEATPVGYYIYGIDIDESNSNPYTSVTYTNDAIGKTPMVSLGVGVDTGDWENVFPFNKIRPCVLSNGVVKYYLDPNDYNKKADGTAAVITGAHGNVMVEIPTVYWKVSKVGSIVSIRYSEKKVDEDYQAFAHRYSGENGEESEFIYIGAYISASSSAASSSGFKRITASQLVFKTNIEARGAGYTMINFYINALLTTLNYVAFKSLGFRRNYTTRAVTSTTTIGGSANVKGMYFGDTTATSSNDIGNKFMGIENLVGLYTHALGLSYRASSNAVLINTGSVTTNPAAYPVAIESSSSDTEGTLKYYNKIVGNNLLQYYPSAINGSTTTYYRAAIQTPANYVTSLQSYMTRSAPDDLYLNVEHGINAAYPTRLIYYSEPRGVKA